MVVAGCGIEIGDVRVGPTPLCDTTSRGLLILMAQSVPTSEYVPCLEELPAGWLFEHAAAETGRAELSFDGGRLGDVDVTLAGSCNPPGDAIGAGDPPGATTYEQGEDGRTRRYVVFSGGCVVIDAPQRLAAAELMREISFISRDRLAMLSDLDL